MTRIMKRNLLLLFMVLGVSEAYAQNLTELPDESDGYIVIDGSQKQFIRKGDAVRAGNFCYQITKDEANQAGQIWWPDSLSLTQNFLMDFVIFAGERGSGADGFAFVMHLDSRGTNATGHSGEGLGLRGIKPSLGIEIDTYRNPHTNLRGCAPNTNIIDPTMIMWQL